MKKEDKIIELLEDNKYLNNLIYGVLLKYIVGCQHISLEKKSRYCYTTASTLDESIDTYRVHKCLGCGALIPVLKKC